MRDTNIFKRLFKRKGFTLVELLAVIVVLGVVITIATTSILGRMRKAKEKAFVDVVLQYLNAAQYESFLDEENPYMIFSFPEHQLESITTQPDAGFIIKDGNKYRLSIWSDNLKVCAVKDFDDPEVVISTTIKKRNICIAQSPDEIIDEDDLEDNEYQIVFNINDSSSTPHVIQKVTYNNSFNLRANTFTKNGYTFKNWNTKADGTGVSYDDEATVTNLTSGKTIHLYAQWELISAQLLTGQALGGKLKTIANESNMTYSTVDNKIESFSRSDVAPDAAIMDSDHKISTDTSPADVYAWYNSTDKSIKWWSDALDVKLASDSRYIFNNMKSLKTVDFTGINSSAVQEFNTLFGNDIALTSVNFASFDTTNARMFKEMFSGCTSLQQIDLSMLETDNIRSLDGMFQNCTSLTSVNFTGWTTPKLESTTSMFSGASAIETINLRGWTTTNLTNMASMFKNCTSLKNLDISTFRTPSLSNMYAAFNNCSSLTSIDLSKFTGESLSVVNTLFQGCTALQEVDMSGIVLSKSVSYAYMFKNCPNLEKIYVNANFNEEYVSEHADVFSGCSNKLVGGSGTIWTSSNKSSAYARIDDPTNNKPGYFSVKAN